MTMNTKIIAGISVDASKVKDLDYNDMMELGLQSKKYNGILKAKELIAAELKKEGINPKETKNGLSRKGSSKSTGDKPSGDSGRGNHGKQRKNSSKGS